MKSFYFLVITCLIVFTVSCKDDPDPKPTITDEPGRHEFSVMADGVERWFTYHIPQTYSVFAPATMVLAFHGGNGSMEEMYGTRTDLIELSEEKGFVLVFPNGQNANGNKGAGTWNGVHCCGYAFQYQGGISDVEFIDVLLDSLDNALLIDPARIHAVGFSNGGHIVHRLAAERPDVFASVVTMGANVGAESPQFSLTYPNATDPIPVLLMHGEADHNAPFNGGSTSGLTGYDFTSFSEGLSFWANNSNCALPAVGITTTGGKGSILTIQYSPCDKDVVGMVFQNVGHGWLDETFAGFDGTAKAIEFFEQHPK